MYLSYNNIIDMFPLTEAMAKMPRLVNLKLNDNLLEDVSPVKEGGFANLQILSLENNKITDRNYKIVKRPPF